MAALIEKFTLPEHEQSAASGVVAVLQAESQTDVGPFLRTSHGADVAIPHDLARLFEHLADAAAQGQQISVAIGDPRLRPREAADELGMSRTYLCRLMDRGEIAFEKVGTHRRIPRSEVDRYRLERAARLAADYQARTSDLPDAPDEPMEQLRGPAPRRPGR